MTKRINKKGYVLVKAHGHPVAQKRGWAFEHRLVWYEAHGPIPPGHDIHHVNHDKADNRLENLVCLSKAEHALEHAEQTRPLLDAFRPRTAEALAKYRREHGAWNKGTRVYVTLNCAVCGSQFDRIQGEVNRNRKRGQANCCSRECRNKRAQDGRLARTEGRS